MKKRIGVFTDSMDSEYQRTVTENLIRSTMNDQIQLIFFACSANIVYDFMDNHLRTIYDLASERILDGILLVPSTLLHAQESLLSSRLGELNTKIPVVVVGKEHSTFHSISLDNKKAMSEIITHMSEHVPLEEMAFISGPLVNEEAYVRTLAWREALEAAELEETPRNTYSGEFLEEDGQKAVDYFLEINRRMPRAILAANDEMAIGAYSRLIQLGYSIPGEVLVTGFDNVQLSRESFPPLTTYDQDLKKIYNNALNTFEALWAKKTLPMIQKVEGRLIIRESCGCIPNLIASYIGRDDADRRRPDSNAPLTIADQQHELFLHLRELICEYILPSKENAGRADRYAEIIARKTQCILMEEDHCSGLMSELSSMMADAILSDIRHTNFEAFLEELRAWLLHYAERLGVIHRAEEVLYHTSLAVSKSMRRKEIHIYNRFRERFKVTRHTASLLANVSSKEEIYSILKEGLKDYGIKRCYMVLYKRPIEYDSDGEFPYPLTSILSMALEENDMLKSQSFVTHNMLPTSIMYQDNWVNMITLALYSRNTHYGYIVMSLDALDATDYETIRTNVSAALKRCQIIDRRKESEIALNSVLKELEISNELLRRQSIKDELTGLYNRRGFYMEAERYFTKASDSKEPFYVIFGDIDGLKIINDTYGHDEGDYAIRTIGHTLMECFGEDAIVARMSGDEFTALLMNEDNHDHINKTIRYIRSRLREIVIEDNKPYTLDISLGCASYDYEILSTMDELLRQADHNLYEIKQQRKMAASKKREDD